MVQQAYAWSYRDGKNDEEEQFVTVLEIPVESALTGMRVSIVADGKINKKHGNPKCARPISN
jgi:hypothetical protein